MPGLRYPAVRPEDLRVAMDLMALGYRRDIVIKWLQGRRGGVVGVRRDLLKKTLPLGKDRRPRRA